MDEVPTGGFTLGRSTFGMLCVHDRFGHGSPSEKAHTRPAKSASARGSVSIAHRTKLDPA